MFPRLQSFDRIFDFLAFELCPDLLEILNMLRLKHNEEPLLVLLEVADRLSDLFLDLLKDGAAGLEGEVRPPRLASGPISLRTLLYRWLRSIDTLHLWSSLERLFV